MTRTTLSPHILAVVPVMLALAQPAHTQNILTLTDAKEQALTRTEEVQVARLRVEQAEHLAASARAQRLPALNLGAGYTHVSETAGIDFQIPGLLSRRIAFGDGNIYEAALTASAPLFTGFRLQHLEEARNKGTLTAREALRAKQLETSAYVTMLYRKAQLANMNIAIYDGQFLYLNEQRRLLSRLLEEGQILAYDTLVLSTRMTAMQVQRAASETDYRNALLSLSVFVNSEQPFEVEEFAGIDDSFADAGQQALVTFALAERPDLSQLEAQSGMQRELADADKGAMYPMISAAVSLRYGKPGVDQVANEWMGYYTAGVSLQWNLWSWGADRHAVEAKQLEVRTTDLRLAQLRRKIGAEIAALLNDRDLIRKNIALLDHQIAQEQQKHTLLAARFMEGLASATELVDAETSMTTALLARKLAAIQYAVKINELAITVGREN